MKTRFGRGAQAVVAVAALAFLSTAEADTTAPSITLRPAEGRVWQTCLKPSEPIKWPWIDGATSARLSVTSLCDGKVSAYDVARASGAIYGTQALPSQPDGSERLYDLTLEQTDGTSVLATDTARVAVIPGVSGGSFMLRPTSGKAWLKADTEHPMFAYDTDWTTNAVATVSLEQSVGGAAATTRDLDGTSGYDVADTSAGSVTALSLLYDGVAAFTGACKYAGQGLLLIFR